MTLVNESYPELGIKEKTEKIVVVTQILESREEN